MRTSPAVDLLSASDHEAVRRLDASRSIGDEDLFDRLRRLVPAMGGRSGMAIIAVATSVVLVVSGCGGAGSHAKDRAARTSPPHAKHGGTLRVLAQADVDSIDPGITYSAYGLVLSL